MHRSSRFPRFLLFVLALFLLLPSAARASITTGILKGTAVDTEGLPVPGVLVTISSETLIGGAQQRPTDDKGRFAFYELPPGTFQLTAEKAGFAKSVRPNLLVNIGRTTTVVVEMQLMESGEEIIVEESRPTIDTEGAAKGEVLTRDFLQRVPTGRDYQSAASQTPGVLGGGNPNVSGSGYDENTYMLDGVNITDPVTGTFSMNFNYDAISQLEILTNGLDPEYGEGLGGVINIVTESGSNKLEFDTSVFYQSGDWSPKIDARYAADGVELAPSGFDSQYDTFFLRAKVSGPILRDRIWYIMSYEHARSLIANTGIELPRDYEGHYLLTKLTFQPTTSHRFTLLGQSDPTTIDNTSQSDRFVAPEAQARQSQGGIVGSLQWDWFIGPEVVLATKLTGHRSSIEVYGVPCTHDKDLGYHPCEPDEAENSLDFDTPGRLGGWTAYDSGNWPYYNFDDRYRYSLNSKLSILQVDALGTHDFKGGIELEHLKWDQVVGYTGNLYFVDINLVNYDPDTLTNYYWVETSGAFHNVATGEHLGAFVQDVWKPVENLTFRYGVRYDRTVQRNDQGEPVVDVGLWGPRVFTAWDPWSDGKTVIRGGYGRVNDSGRLAVAAFNSQNNTFGYKMYYGEPAYNYESLTAENVGEYDGEVNDIVWDNTVAPHADEFLIGGQREIIQDVAFGVSFLARFTQNVYDYDEVNYIWDEDGNAIIGYSNGNYEGIFRLRTADFSRRDYYQTDVDLKKEFSKRTQFRATYSYVVSQGSVQTALEGSLVNPEQSEYAYGNLYTDVRHQVKASGSWDLPDDPWTTRVGFALEYYSGYPLSRYYYGDAYSGYGIRFASRGTYTRTEPMWLASILLQQAVPVKKGNLWAMGEVDNLFNNQYADNWDAGYIYAQDRWVITSRQTPLQVSLGLRYEF